MNAKSNFTVRKQSSGYTFSESWYVFSLGLDGHRKGRVSATAFRSRKSAEISADSMNRTSGYPLKYCTEDEL